MLQPLLVSQYALKQATECVRSILKIDDIVSFLFACVLLSAFRFWPSAKRTKVEAAESAFVPAASLFPSVRSLSEKSLPPALI